jgi:hypothetical protein
MHSSNRSAKGSHSERQPGPFLNQSIAVGGDSHRSSRDRTPQKTRQLLFRHSLRRCSRFADQSLSTCDMEDVGDHVCCRPGLGQWLRVCLPSLAAAPPAQFLWQGASVTSQHDGISRRTRTRDTWFLSLGSLIAFCDQWNSAGGSRSRFSHGNQPGHSARQVRLFHGTGRDSLADPPSGFPGSRLGEELPPGPP